MNGGDSSLEKGLALLRTIAQDRGATSFRDLAERLDIPLSTAHRLLATLKEQGFVGRVGAGRYDIGIGLVSLADGRNTNALLADTARPLLDSLARQSRLTVHLGVLEDGMVTYLIKSDGQSAKVAAGFTREGMQLEAYCSAVGRVLLAGLTRAEQELYLSDGPFVQLTPRSVTSPTALREILKAVSVQGFAEDDREIAEDLWCLAVPLRSGTGELIAAISASMSWSPDQTRERGRLVERLQNAASRISARL